MYIGIVGHEAAKFTADTEAMARSIIRSLLSPPEAVLVSGHCHLGGIDIWAEEEADALGRAKDIFAPKKLVWGGPDGFQSRNLKIATRSDVVHCLVIAEYPPTYTGMRFDYCYHCHTHDHIKSGGCWTARRCHGGGVWHVIREDGAGSDPAR
jgi:hypothetical protein